MTPPLRIALGQYDTAWHDPVTSLARAADVVARAARAGAGLVVLPEMCTTGFTMETEWAEPLEGPSVGALGALAARHDVHLLAGVSIREGAGEETRASNMALLFDAAGRLAGHYRKQRLFAFAGEHAHYVPGAEPPFVAAIDGVRVSALVCYDLRFPELFGAVAREADAIVVVANWPDSRRAHWLALLRARAIENQCYIVGVNRIGVAGGLAYAGDSIAFDPWGEEVASAGDQDAAAAVTCVDVDPARVADIRTRFPFLRDR